MAEMSLERACEILTARRYRKAAWRVSFDIGTGDPRYAYVADNSMVMLDADLAIAMAEKLERDAAPPADAGEGDADLEIAISKLRATTAGRLESEEFRLTDDSATHLVEDLVGLRFTTRELDALLAAAERGGGLGPGPATRYVMEKLREASEKSLDPNYFAIHAEYGGPAFSHIKHKRLAAALRECGMEAPR